MKQIVILVSTVIVFVAALGFYLFLMTDITKFLATIATIKEQISTAGLRDSLQRSQEIFVQETALERDEIETFVASDSGIVNIIETIEAAGRREKVLVTIGSVVVQSPPELKQHELVRITMSARGGFPLAWCIYNGP